MPKDIQLLKRNLKYPDVTQDVPDGQIQRVDLPEMTLAYTVFQPGWKWSESIRPTAGTDFCEVTHQGLCNSGRLHIEMQNGETMEIEPGDVFTIPAGHDAWVVGDESFVGYDFSDEMKNYAGGVGTTH